MDSLANWGGPRPSEYGLCSRDEDLLYIVSYHQAKARMMAYEEYTSNPDNKALDIGG